MKPHTIYAILIPYRVTHHPDASVSHLLWDFKLCMLMHANRLDDRYSHIRVWQWNHSLTTSEYLYYTVVGPRPASCIELCMKLYPWNVDTSTNQDTFSCPKCVRNMYTERFHCIISFHSIEWCKNCTRGHVWWWPRCMGRNWPFVTDSIMQYATETQNCFILDSIAMCLNLIIVKLGKTLVFYKLYL